MIEQNKGANYMTKKNRIVRRSDIPVLVRWFRGHVLLLLIIGFLTVLRWLGDISPIDLNAMPDGWVKSVVFAAACFVISSVFLFGLPLLLHDVSFSVVAAPAIKTAVEKQDMDGLSKPDPPGQ